MAGADASADKAKARLNDIRRATVEEIKRLLMKLDTEPGKSGLLSTRQALANADAIRTQVIAKMRDLGIVVVRDMERAVVEAARAQAQGVDLGIFTPQNAQDIQRIADGMAEEIAKGFKDAQSEIAKAIRVAVSGSQDLADVIEAVAVKVDSTALRAQSAVDSAIMATGRYVTIQAGEKLASESGAQIVYLYMGPSDSRTRTFCLEHIDQAWSMQALDAQDNGENQPKPVSIFLGGYNCRHDIGPITIEEAKSRGVKVNL